MLRIFLLERRVRRVLRASVVRQGFAICPRSSFSSGWLSAPRGFDGQDDRLDVLCIICITPPRSATAGTAEHLSRPDDRSAKAGLNANANSTQCLKAP
jgi:hypothetical protein